MPNRSRPSGQQPKSPAPAPPLGATAPSAVPDPTRPADRAEAPWTFLSNHAHVLICIAADPEVRMRDLASRVGITERAVQRIVTELEEGGYLARQKEGRRNRYLVTASRPLRHPIERHCSTEALIDLVLGPNRRSSLSGPKMS